MNKREAKKQAKKIASVILASHPIGELLDEEGYSEENKHKINEAYEALIELLKKA
jgi:hypothetical protein